ncbi:MAG: peroxide stress protein YaaA [Alphaproteobacteria bacterium]|nr:peroxide stress protein YaaA [Alphaproteobacteria bacterium]
MLLLLSPAKSLDWSPVDLDLDVGTPPLMKDTAVLMRRCKRLKTKQLRTLMDLSDDLASLNHDRFQEMDDGAPDEQRDRPAALAFDGDVYKGLDARSLDRDALAWANRHVAILSGLYGALRPLDLIQPYRLEMGTDLSTRRGKNLYAFWGDSVTKVLRGWAEDAGADTVVNLASNEYYRVVKARKLGRPVVTPVFKEQLEDGRLQVISFYAKHARGAMARWAAERALTDVSALQDCDADGYAFDAALSDDATWVFTRPKPPPVNG